MQEAHHQVVWINSADAAERGIKNDDDVFIYNDRGTVRIGARVTEKIAPGVASLPQGAWFTPEPASEGQAARRGQPRSSGGHRRQCKHIDVAALLASGQG